MDETRKLVRYTHIPITKRKKQADGSLIVWGDITDDSLDSDGEIVDPEFAAAALADWFNGGAPMFSQHCEFYPPAGQGLSLEFNPQAPTALRAHIYEPTAIQHVENGVFKDFSVGWYDPEYVPDRSAPNGRMVGGWAREVSLVDDGANKNARIKGFTVAKAKRKGLPPQLYGVLGGRDSQPERDPDAAEAALRADGDVITRALKSAMTRRAEKALAAARYYAALKRDLDPDVGGGTDRDKLDDSDFVFIEGTGDDKQRKFPIVTPGDVSDAVSSWGRYKGPASFDEFKAKLTALAKKKGPSFVAELPQNWRDEMDEKAKARKKAPAADKQHPDGAKPPAADDLPDGQVKCPTCDGEGTILEGNRKCPDCKGTGHVPEALVQDGKVKRPEGKAKAVKQADDLELDDLELDDEDEDDDPDDDVDEAIGDLMADVGAAAAAQEADEAGGADKPTDDAVEDAIDETAAAVGDLAAAQAADEAAGEPADKAKDEPAPTAAGLKGRKAKPKDDAPPAADGAEANGDDQEAEASQDDEKDVMGDKAKKTKTMEHVDGDPKCKCAMCKANRKEMKRKAKAEALKTRRAEQRKRVPLGALVAHDAVCPAMALGHEDVGKALKGISPQWFGARHAQARESASAKEVREAYEALAAATKVSLLPLPTFERARVAAHKAFMNAYPDLADAGFTLRSPDQFRRPFLASSNDETPTGGFALPLPDMAATFGPEDFDRLTPIPNEARPSPSGGVPAKDLVGKAKKAAATALKRKAPKKGMRQFYTNAAKDEHAAAMGMLHDYLAKTFPNICPAGHGEDDGGSGHGPDADVKETMPKDGQKHDVEMAGLQPAAEMPSPKPLPEPSGAGTGTLKPASTQGADKGKASKKTRAEKAAGNGEVARLERELRRARKGRKAAKKAQRRFERKITEQLSRPAPWARKARGPGANFAPVVAAKSEDLAALNAASAELRARIKSRNSTVSRDALREAINLGLSPEKVASLLTSE